MRHARGMADILWHRGPDDAGCWTDADAGIAMAHRRLSILDLSPAGHQPMVSASGRYVIVYNGEVYNHDEIRQELDSHSRHAWRGHSDTEVLLASVEQWEVREAVKRWEGMFSFALWDRTERQLWLGRDRMGEKPLYYAVMGGAFLFGSELKALQTHPDWRGELDRDALALYFRFNYIPAPWTIYRGVRKLLPGTLLRLIPAHLDHLPEPEPYWQVSEVAHRGMAEPLTGTPDELANQLDQVLQEAISRQMVADVPLGAFLSGGVDSSTIVALMQAQTSQPVRTFTIGFSEADYNEAEHAKAVARHLGTNHTELYVTPNEAMAVIPRLPEMYDEPFADASQIPTCLVASLARSQVTVSLSGDGGDELFGGYNRYFWGRDIWRRIGPLPRPLRRLAARMITGCAPGTWDRLFEQSGNMLPSRMRQRSPGDKLHKLARVLNVASPGELYRALVTHWPEPTLLVPGSREPSTLADQAVTDAMGRDFTSAMMLSDMLTYLPDDILVKVDRAAMGVSLETRVPLLSHRVVEFAWRVPLSYKVRNGQGKWLLRQVLYRYVPPELIERPKMGFGVPIDS